MVTSGANQAYANIVLSCVDHDDQVVFFAPYYFNHVNISLIITFWLL